MFYFLALCNVFSAQGAAGVRGLGQAALRLEVLGLRTSDVLCQGNLSARKCVSCVRQSSDSVWLRVRSKKAQKDSKGSEVASKLQPNSLETRPLRLQWPVSKVGKAVSVHLVDRSWSQDAWDPFSLSKGRGRRLLRDPERPELRDGQDGEVRRLRGGKAELGELCRALQVLV